MTLSRLNLASGAGIVLLSITTGLNAQEQDISCRSVPAAVRAAFEKAYPKAVIRGCAKEIEQGKTAYEISSREGGTRRDVLFYPDGSLIVVEEAVAMGTLPDTVQQAVHRKFPKGEITLVEKITRDGTLRYEFRIRDRGKLVETIFDTNGEQVGP